MRKSGDDKNLESLSARFQETCPCIPLIDNHLDKLMVKLGGGSGTRKMALLWDVQPVLESEVLAFFFLLGLPGVVPCTPQ